MATDETIDGEVIYTIRFRPQRYRVKEQINIRSSLPYYAIVDVETENEIGFCVTENDAKTVVLAMDYIHAVIVGDQSAQRQLTAALEKLRN